MNQGRTANGKEVIEEQKRASDPDYAKKKGEERHKRALEKDAKAEGQEGGATGKNDALPKGKEYLLDTVETVEMKEAKKKKKNPDAFGWDVFNQESLARAHDKRLNSMVFQEEEYTAQAEQDQNSSSAIAGFDFVASEAGKERLANAMDNINQKKKQFSRRRMHVEEEDVTYVNERNRHFNKKMERAFGSYTEETRQNLERGTAL